jgi:hypothetical protein
MIWQYISMVHTAEGWEVAAVEVKPDEVLDRDTQTYLLGSLIDIIHDKGRSSIEDDQVVVKRGRRAYTIRLDWHGGRQWPTEGMVRH